jgi:hypothetical protein
MSPASERLHAAIVEGRLKHPDKADLNSHVRQAVAEDTREGGASMLSRLLDFENLQALCAGCNLAKGTA